jgi:hypothetical protein
MRMFGERILEVICDMMDVRKRSRSHLHSRPHILDSLRVGFFGKDARNSAQAPCERIRPIS